MKDKAIVTGDDLQFVYNKNKVEIKGKNLEISDNYHSVKELYSHRIMLFCALLQLNKNIAWKSKNHSDGSNIKNWFVAGLDLPSGMITYHIPDNIWNQLSNIKELDNAPEFDGHTSIDVLHRLNSWLNILNEI